MRLQKIILSIFAVMLSGAVARADAPAWLHAAVNTPLPPHDDRTDAVVLYSETIVSVQSTTRIKKTVREAIKILRPSGSEHGFVAVSFHPNKKVTSLRGWCVPASGKDYEVKEKDAIEISVPKITGSELISDVRDKVIRIPAADVGNVVGYEYETEETPLVLQEVWGFQGADPVKNTKFTLQLPPGWEYRAWWRNYTDTNPTASGNQWQWNLSDISGLREEAAMPPTMGVFGYMLVNFYPPGSPDTDRTFRDWQQMGLWYSGLTHGRTDANPEIKQKVAALTANAATPVAKMTAIGNFVQKDIRYVAITLGIGGIQPHSASEVFQHRYGDCKDKVTLARAMLKEVGVESYYVIVNSERGSVDSTSPAQIDAFDHVILAIKMPEGIDDPALAVTMQHAKLGKLLFFDPTVEYVPFGSIGGYLQDGYGLLVTPDGGDLVKIPKLTTTAAGVSRIGRIKLDASGNISGEFVEVHRGDSAWGQREYLKTVNKSEDRVKILEKTVAQSLPNFNITKAQMENVDYSSQPFGWNYSLVAARYAKTAGDLLLVRPRVLGQEASGFLETKEPRKFPVMFEGPKRDQDTFEITIPSGYEVDDLPPPVDVDYGFASYHSKTEANGSILKYTRTMEIKELTVPLNKVEDLKKLYRIVAGDERNTAVLKPVAH